MVSVQPSTCEMHLIGKQTKNTLILTLSNHAESLHTPSHQFNTDSSV